MQSFDASRRTFVRGEGTALFDASGARLYDAVSSIWTIVHGHCHPVIAGEIARQAAELDHATTLGATNPVAEELAQQLCALTGLDYAFFASDGASAIEAALKMALQYWQNVGEPQRTRFVRLVDSYHGDTAAAMSVSDISVFKSRFGAITFEAIPYDRAEALNGDDVAAVIVEPLVQAAAGIRMIPPAFYDVLLSLDALVIVDEIATGFGRTGTMFAYEQTNVKPDLVCVGKGITGGTMALSATLATQRIYESFLAAFEERKHFFHGHSYAGNPIACAAALASLDLFTTEKTLENVNAIASVAGRRLEVIAAHPAVKETRARGAMIGIELRDATRGWPVADALYERGHFTRPIGGVVQFVPPLSSTAGEIHDFFDALAAVLPK